MPENIANDVTYEQMQTIEHLQSRGDDDWSCIDDRAFDAARDDALLD